MHFPQILKIELKSFLLITFHKLHLLEPIDNTKKSFSVMMQVAFSKGHISYLRFSSQNFFAKESRILLAFSRQFPNYVWFILFISNTSRISFCGQRLFVAWSTVISQFRGIISPSSMHKLCKTKHADPIFFTLSFWLSHFLDKMHHWKHPQ